MHESFREGLDGVVRGKKGKSLFKCRSVEDQP